jgi:hypothetical protein
MSSPYIKSFQATSVAIAAYLIVTAAANDKVELANAPSDLLIGTSGSLGADADGMVDVTMNGFGEVTLGGSVAFGDPITSDANGKGVKGEPSEAGQVRYIGFAMEAGVAGDVIQYQPSLGSFSPIAAA